MFAGGDVWFDGQEFHVPGAQQAPRDVQPFVSPTYDKMTAPKLPPQPRRPRARHKRPPRPWHAEESSRLPRLGKQKVEALCPYHTEVPPRKMKRRKARPPAKEDDVREAQASAEAERRRAADAAEAETALIAIFNEHAPQLLVSVPTLMTNWRGREWKMVNRIRKDYELKEQADEMYHHAIRRPEQRLPRIGHPGRELGWLGDERIGEDGSRPTIKTLPKSVELPRIGHPGRELGWIGVSMNDKHCQ